MDERRGQSVYVSFARDYREWFIIKQAHANKTYFHASFHVHHNMHENKFVSYLEATFE